MKVAEKALKKKSKKEKKNRKEKSEAASSQRGLLQINQFTGSINMKPDRNPTGKGGGGGGGGGGSVRALLALAAAAFAGAALQAQTHTRLPLTPPRLSQAGQLRINEFTGPAINMGPSGNPPTVGLPSIAGPRGPAAAATTMPNLGLAMPMPPPPPPPKAEKKHRKKSRPKDPLTGNAVRPPPPHSHRPPACCLLPGASPLFASVCTKRMTVCQADGGGGSGGGGGGSGGGEETAGAHGGSTRAWGSCQRSKFRHCRSAGTSQER